STSFKMKEYYDVMNTIKAFTAEDATVIVGNVFDETIGDGLRVTMVATGLNGVAGRRQQKPELRVMTQVRDGTTGQAVYVGGSGANAMMGMSEDETPAVFSSNGRRATVEAMKQSGVEEYDIPAFLRKQAD
ncbi:MAG: cell division protein FtsZ, partial [Nitrosomonadales bacterium]|nr:cell division protein FtsZ [Nitrosomonadales bacterium]